MRPQEKPSQSSDKPADAELRMERRRRTMRREAKRVIRGVVRLSENAALKGASEVMRVVQKVNGPIRQRIELDD